MATLSAADPLAKARRRLIPFLFLLYIVAYLDRNGNQIQDQTRLAGNVLLWQHGDVTFRIEADTTKGRALRIAASAR